MKPVLIGNGAMLLVSLALWACNHHWVNWGYTIGIAVGSVSQQFANRKPTTAGKGE